MSNWKHTIIAMCAVLTVVSLSVLQMNGSVYVKADKNQTKDELEILKGDGEGVTPAFADYDYWKNPMLNITVTNYGLYNINGNKVRIYSIFTTGMKWFKRCYYSCRKKYYLKTCFTLYSN